MYSVQNEKKENFENMNALKLFCNYCVIFFCSLIACVHWFELLMVNIIMLCYV